MAIKITQSIINGWYIYNESTCKYLRHDGNWYDNRCSTVSSVSIVNRGGTPPPEEYGLYNTEEEAKKHLANCLGVSQYAQPISTTKHASDICPKCHNEGIIFIDLLTSRVSEPCPLCQGKGN